MWLSSGHKIVLNLTWKRCNEHISTKTSPLEVVPPLVRKPDAAFFRMKTPEGKGDPDTTDVPAESLSITKVNPCEATVPPRQVTKWWEIINCYFIGTAEFQGGSGRKLIWIVLGFPKVWAEIRSEVSQLTTSRITGFIGIEKNSRDNLV